MRHLTGIGYLDTYYFHFPSHMHMCWEIVYYTHGTGMTKVGEDSIPFRPGTIICLPPGIPHAEDAEQGYKNIFFSVASFGIPSRKIPVYQDSESQIIKGLLIQMHHEFHQRRRNWQNIVDCMLDTIDQFIISFSQEKEMNPYVEMMKNLLISNLSNRNFMVGHLADKIPLSKDFARRLFVKTTGKTPTEYLTEKRIDYARQIIGNRVSGTFHIKEISELCGFEDPYYFSRVFKKVTGKSPSQWATFI